MDKIEKVIALYKYIKELCALKYRVVTDVDKQYWTCFIKDIPEDTENIKIFYRDRVEGEPDNDTVLLEVKKPEFQRCPQPPEILEEWLIIGWDRYTNTATYKETLIDISSSAESVEEKKQIEHFEHSAERVNAYKKWTSIRSIWVEKQKKINNTRHFFAQLFQMHIDLERDLESLELMIGEGLIQDLANTSVRHPILLKRAKFIFDAKNNIITMHDTDTEPELYTLLLQEMEEINHSAVKELKDELRDNFYHPLDRNDTPDFLKVLTHKLCSDSKFIKDTGEKVGREDKLITRLSPVFFIRKRIDGTLKAIEEIISNIERTGFIPGHLIDIVDGGLVEIPQINREQTIDEKLAALSGENIDILLSKEANREQLEIAERIENYNAVLVQGPPGTGKTHTIANLLGHFLAQGKNVLVTSHTKKALSVLKDKVSDEIKNLCVSVLDDTNSDMERSVDGISEYLSRYTSSEIKRKVDEGGRKRSEIIKQLAEVRRRIYAIKYKEFEPIVYNGVGISPARAATFVNENSEELSYIPGKVRFPHPLPLTQEELFKLYRSNTGITEDEEIELANNVPNPELLPTPVSFATNIRLLNENISNMFDLGNSLKLKLTEDFIEDKVYGQSENEKFILVQKTSSEALQRLSEYISTFNDVNGWMISAAADGNKSGGYRARWDMLIDAIEDTAKFADSIVTRMIGYSVDIYETDNLSQLIVGLQKIAEIYAKKGKIGKLDKFLNKSIEITLSQVKVNKSEISSEKECSLAMSYIELLEKRNNTAILWDELIAKHNVTDFFNLNGEPEQICLQWIPVIKRYLDWYGNEHSMLCNLLTEAGFDIQRLFPTSDLDSEFIKTEKILSTVKKDIPRYIKVAECYLKMRQFELQRKEVINVLSEQNRKNSSICRMLINALLDNKIEQYEILFHNLRQLYEKIDLKKQREELLDKIEPIAPNWADAIRRRLGIHGETTCPQTIENAWKWKQFAGIIDSITAEPFEELQNKSVILCSELRNITAKVAANSAWYNLVVRTERDISMKQALQGWKLTVRKIGKGTGKNAPTLKRQARDLMAKCQSAVPAWIMPISKAVESLNPTKNRFDVIIIDEASQADISALAIVYMAKKIIVVGDDKQVSPMAVGMDIERINALKEMYIKGSIPNWHLYDAKTSLYDIAATTFQALMLREHFRCVPDIIGYSNKLSYDFKIKPLRDASSCTVTPHVIQYRVFEGMRDGKRKINRKEAETIVSLIMACLEQKEYDGMTFGVISLLGDEQAQLIQEIILEKVEPSIIESRCILCGNASHFQGDERDIVFISIVDSNEGDGPLTLAGEGTDQSRKQRYNVAVSRAKNQLWVVHSLDYSKDLKPGDLRRDLLEYVENPRAYAQLAEKIRVNSESHFEESVGKALLSAGYNIEQQREVGAYRIDMVASYKGQCVAIECDGEHFHSGDEKVRSDMERQAILERLGWRFIRIRGSEYYSNPRLTMQRVIKELNALGIFPEEVIAHSEEMEKEESELISRIKIRSAQIIDELINYGDETSILPINKSEHEVFKGQKSESSTKKKDVLTETESSLKNMNESTLKKNIKVKTINTNSSIIKLEKQLTLDDFNFTKINPFLDREIEGKGKFTVINNCAMIYNSLTIQEFAYLINQEESVLLEILKKFECSTLTPITYKVIGYELNFFVYMQYCITDEMKNNIPNYYLNDNFHIKSEVIDVPGFVNVSQLSKYIKVSIVDILKVLISNGIMLSTEQELKKSFIAVIAHDLGLKIRFETRFKQLEIKEGMPTKTDVIGNDSTNSVPECTEGLDELLYLANFGNLYVQSELGLLYFIGDGVEKNYNEALKWFKVVAKKGDAYAQRMMYLCWQKIRFEEMEEDWIRLAAENGDFYAKGVLGSRYFFGDGIEQDYEKAIEWLTMAAEDGSFEAQSFLGGIYFRGDGVKTDYWEAAKWYKLAAGEVFREEECRGFDKERYEKGFEKDSGSYFNYLEDSANAEREIRYFYEKHNCYLGYLYYEGIFVEKNYDEAFKFLNLAVELEDIDAMRLLGNCYYEGYGCEKDFYEAAKYFEKATMKRKVGAEYLFRCVPDYKKIADEGKIEKLFLSIAWKKKIEVVLDDSWSGYMIFRDKNFDALALETSDLQEIIKSLQDTDSNIDPLKYIKISFFNKAIKYSFLTDIEQVLENGYYRISKPKELYLEPVEEYEI